MSRLQTVYKEIAICVIPVIVIGLLARVATGTFSWDQIFYGQSKQSARFIGQAQNVTLISGQKHNLWLAIENTGPENWTQDGPNAVLLESSRLISDPWYTAGSTWLSQNKIKLWEESVAVGQTGHFFFTIEDDPGPGKYTATFNVVDANLNPLRGLQSVKWRLSVEEPRYEFRLVDHSPELTGKPGNQVLAWVRYQNTGNIPWKNYGEHPLALAAADSESASRFLVSNSWVDDRRVAWLDQSTVEPGQEGTFSFLLKIPEGIDSEKLELRPEFENLDVPDIGAAYLQIAAGLESSPAAVAPLVASPSRFYSTADLNLTAVSVGHGDCYIARTPAGQTLVYDTAHPSRAQAVVQALRRRGLEKIDYLFLSHPHWDHIGGAAAILNNFEVGQVYINGEGYPFDTYSELARSLGKISDRVKLVARGEVIELEDDLRVEILHPEKTLSGIGQEDEAVNNNSLTARLVFADGAILFPGDLYQSGLEELLNSGQDLSANILVLPHHGTNGFGEVENRFLDAVAPAVVLKSSDWSEYREQTSPELSQYLSNRKIKLLNTAEGGEIDLALSSKGAIKGITDSIVWK